MADCSAPLVDRRARRSGSSPFGPQASEQGEETYEHDLLESARRHHGGMPNAPDIQYAGSTISTVSITHRATLPYRELLTIAAAPYANGFPRDGTRPGPSQET
jgi:hypothetical protein